MRPAHRGREGTFSSKVWTDVGFGGKPQQRAVEIYRSSERPAVEPLVFGVRLRDVSGTQHEYRCSGGGVVAGVRGVGNTDRSSVEPSGDQRWLHPRMQRGRAAGWQGRSEILLVVLHGESGQ